MDTLLAHSNGTTFWAFAKNTSYVLAFIASIEWLGFDPQSLGIYAALMIIDVITGVLRAGMVDGCRSVTSANGKRGVLSKILALSGLFAVGLMGKGVGFDVAGIMQGVVTVFILAETYSILGNVYSARTGKPKLEFDAIAWLTLQIRELLLKFVK